MPRCIKAKCTLHCENITKILCLIFSLHLHFFILLCSQSISVTFSCWWICCIGQSFSTAEIILHSHSCPARLSLSHEPPLVFEKSVKTCHLSFLSCSQVMASDRLGSWLVFFSDSCYIIGFPDLRHHQPVTKTRVKHHFKATVSSQWLPSFALNMCSWTVQFTLWVAIWIMYNELKDCTLSAFTYSIQHLLKITGCFFFYHCTLHHNY